MEDNLSTGAPLPLHPQHTLTANPTPNWLPEGGDHVGHPFERARVVEIGEAEHDLPDAGFSQFAEAADLVGDGARVHTGGVPGRVLAPGRSRSTSEDTCRSSTPTRVVDRCVSVDLGRVAVRGHAVRAQNLRLLPDLRHPAEDVGRIGVPGCEPQGATPATADEKR